MIMQPRSIMRNSKRIFATVILAVFAMQITTHAQACHGGGAAAGGPTPVSSPAGTGAGISGYAAALTCGIPDDSTKLLYNVFGFISTSSSRDGHKGEPLGTGGKYPIAYDQWLFVAHTNSQEALIDEALNPVGIVDTPNPPENPSKWNGYGQSKWELEAVNTMILSPFAALEFPGIGGINVMYSRGTYEKPVRRQGTISKMHDNVVINAYVNYSMRKKK